MRKLDEGMNAKLTLVSAQAGFGKTTALSEWVKQSDSLVVWVSLDKKDNDWIQFWSYVTASVEEKVPVLVWPYILLLRKGLRLRDRIKVIIVQSVTLQRLGQKEAELVQLETALHLAEPENVYRKLGVNNRVQALILAKERNLLA